MTDDSAADLFRSLLNRPPRRNILAAPESHLKRPLQRCTQLRVDRAKAASTAATAETTAGERRSIAMARPRDPLPRRSSSATTTSFSSSSAPPSLASTGSFHGNRYFPPVAAAHSSDGPMGRKAAANAPLGSDLIARDRLLRHWTLNPRQAPAPEPETWQDAKDRGRTFVEMRDGSSAEKRLVSRLSFFLSPSFF